MDVLPVKANLLSEVKVRMVPKRGEFVDDSTALRPIADFAVGSSSDLRSGGFRRRQFVRPQVRRESISSRLSSSPLITALRP